MEADEGVTDLSSELIVPSSKICRFNLPERLDRTAFPFLIQAIEGEWTAVPKSLANSVVAEMENAVDSIDSQIKAVEDQILETEKLAVVVDSSSPPKKKRSAEQLSTTTTTGGSNRVRKKAFVKKKNDNTSTPPVIIAANQPNENLSNTQSVVLPNEADKPTTLGLWQFLVEGKYFEPVVSLDQVARTLELEDERIVATEQTPSKIYGSTNNLKKEEPPVIRTMKSEWTEEGLEIDAAFRQHSISQRLLSVIQSSPSDDVSGSINSSNSSSSSNSRPGASETSLPICFENPDTAPACSSSLVVPCDTLPLEERLRLELKMVGLMGMNSNNDAVDEQLEAREDDELCVKIRSMKQELLEQVKCNNSRKAFLRNVLKLRIDEELEAVQVEEESLLLIKRYNKIWKKKVDAEKKRQQKEKKLLKLEAERLGYDAAYPMPKSFSR